MARMPHDRSRFEPIGNRALAALAQRAQVKPKTINLSIHPYRRPFDLQCRLLLDRCRMDCATNGEMLLLGVAGVSTCLAFSVNREDALFLLREPVALPEGSLPWSVFSNSVQAIGMLPAWLSSPVHRDLLTGLALGPRDWLRVYKNGVHLILEPRSDDENWALMQALCDLTKALPPEEVYVKPDEELIDAIPVHLSRLPAELHSLIPLLREWSISDDVARSEKWEAASTEELQALVEAVSPKMAAINAYLDEADKLTPYPEDAMVLGRLAECVCEVQLDLERRHE